MSNLALIINAAIFVALLISYVVLEALGHPDEALLGLLVGQLGAVSVAKGADAYQRNGGG